MIDIENKITAYKELFDNAPNGMCLVGIDGIFLYANQKFCDFVGYTVEQLKHKSYVEITHPDDITVDKSQIQNIKDGNINFYKLEKRFIKKNGEIVWVKLWASGIRGADAKNTQVFAQIENVSESREIAEEMEHYKTFYFRSPVGFITTEFETGKIIKSNYALARILGYGPHELTGRIEDYFAKPEERAKLVAELSESGRINDYLLEFKAKDGSSRWLNISLTMSDDCRTIDAVVVDITTTVLAENKFRIIQEKQIELLKQIGSAADLLGRN
jgi:PAS domain S-box-containing protein